MKIVRLALFFWGVFSCAVIAYFLERYLLASQSDSLRHELLEGVAIGFVYGAPAWIALPLLVRLGRESLSKVATCVLLSPVALVLLLATLYAALVVT